MLSRKCIYLTTASEHELYEICPERWYIEKVKFIKPGATETLVLGKIKHKFLEREFEAGLDYLTPEFEAIKRIDLENYIRRRARKARNEIIEENSKEIKEMGIKRRKIRDILKGVFYNNLHDFVDYLSERKKTTTIKKYVRGEDLQRPLINKKVCLVARPDYIINFEYKGTNILNGVFISEIKSGNQPNKIYSSIINQITASHMCLEESKDMVKNLFGRELEIMDFGVVFFNNLKENKIKITNREKKRIKENTKTMRKSRAREDDSELRKNYNACSFCPEEIKIECEI